MKRHGLFLALIVAVQCAPSLASAQLTTGEVRTVAEGFQFTEGPLWIPGTGLVFSDIPADTIFRADGSVYLRPSGNSNGLTLDNSGRLIRCEHGNRRVSRVESDGSMTVLASEYEGKQLNSPNDATVRSDGWIFFTDPPYGLEDRTKELPFNGVFALSPKGTLQLIADDFMRPNGIGLSPDERWLYVTDTQAGHIRAFPIDNDGNVGESRILCKVPIPDGMAVDTEGNIWTSSSQGIVVFGPEGTRLQTIQFAQIPANCTFGGEDGRTLFVTARTAVYAIDCSGGNIQRGE